MVYSHNPYFQGVVQKGLSFLKESRLLVIVGDTGSGKSHLAEYLHRLTGGTVRDFVSQSCAALGPEQFISQLFGHTKGAFSDAVRDFQGLAGICSRGTMCLEELPQLHPQIQAGLLRFLQSFTYRPLGGTVEKLFLGGLIFTSNQTIDSLMKQNILRKDFAFRILGSQVTIPPLHRRPEDLDMLVTGMVEDIRNELPQRKDFDPSVFDELRQVPLSGNLHELKSIVLQNFLHGRSPKPLIETFSVNTSQLPDTGTLKGDLKILEKSLILRTLSHLQWDLQKTASTLGISRRSLFYKLKEYDLNREENA